MPTKFNRIQKFKEWMNVPIDKPLSEILELSIY